MCSIGPGEDGAQSWRERLGALRRADALEPMHATTDEHGAFTLVAVPDITVRVTFRGAGHEAVVLDPVRPVDVAGVSLRDAVRVDAR